MLSLKSDISGTNKMNRETYRPIDIACLPKEDEDRIEKIFAKLDVDGDGRIDIHDLSVALKELGLNQKYAKEFFDNTLKSSTGNITLSEFIYYVREHEKNLRLQFSHLDKNKDGKVDVMELISAFADLGIAVNEEEAKCLLQRMDTDGSLTISYDEWRDYLLLAPAGDIRDLIRFWRHSTYLDIGEDLNVPDDFTAVEMQSGLWWRHLVSGGVAGAISRTATAPLDRLKVVLQVSKRRIPMVECMREMLQEGGIRSLWRGNGINILKIAPESALKFAAYEQCKRFMLHHGYHQSTHESPTLKIRERFVAGAFAGAFSQTLIYPMEVLKTRFALRKTGQYSGIVDAVRKIYAREGLRAFYRGYVPNVMGIIPYAGIDLAVYETLKTRFLELGSGKGGAVEHPSMLVVLACGSVSCTLGQMCSYPLALVRTRLQAAGAPAAGARRVFADIIQREGPFGLYRGITPNFIKVIPAVSISYVVYEQVSRALGVRMS